MELLTENLRLRPPEPPDLAGVLALRMDPRSREHLGAMSPEVVRRQFEHARHSWMLGEPSLLVLHRRETGAFVGLAGPWGLFGRGDAEITWEIRPELWGRGYGLEAARAVLDWVFGELGWAEARLFIARRNRASLALARRLGAEPVSEWAPRAPHRRPDDLLMACRRESWLGAAAPSLTREAAMPMRGGGGTALPRG